MIRRTLVLILIAAGSLQAQVSFDRIVRADQESQNWLTYSGTFFSQRHSQLTQITPTNVKDLEPQWIFQARTGEASNTKFEATALVVDGVLYTVQPPNDIVALDAATGRQFWIYSYTPSPLARPCCGRVNRGLAMLGDTLFMATIDAHLIAVDAKGGRPIWNIAVAKPDLNLTYWGIGNPGSDYNGDERGGDNLYSSSVVALDADTGKLKWYFQFTPHDEFDYDSVQIPVLADLDWQGSPRKVMLWANRNGFFYVLDRTTGTFLLGKPFVDVSWASGLDQNGRPIRVHGKVPSREGTLIYPGNQGGTNWYSPSYSPSTGLFYIPSWANYSTLYVKQDVDYVEGLRFGGGTGNGPKAGAGVAAGFNYRKEEEGFGAVRAIDPRTGDMKWQFKMSDVTDAGILTTASDLLFTGGREGYFFALDARDGK